MFNPKDYEKEFPYVNNWWFKLLHHWLCWFGNYQEPLPYPLHRLQEARESRLPVWLYWIVRNPAHNLTHHWFGITPIGKRYEWLTPESAGWYQTETHWVHPDKWIKLPRYNGWFGWQKRGNLRIGPDMS